MEPWFVTSSSVETDFHYCSEASMTEFEQVFSG
jgi:hypothetical protein